MDIKPLFATHQGEDKCTSQKCTLRPVSVSFSA